MPFTDMSAMDLTGQNVVLRTAYSALFESSSHLIFFGLFLLCWTWLCLSGVVFLEIVGLLGWSVRVSVAVFAWLSKNCCPYAIHIDCNSHKDFSRAANHCTSPVTSITKNKMVFFLAFRHVFDKLKQVDCILCPISPCHHEETFPMWWLSEQYVFGSVIGSEPASALFAMHTEGLFCRFLHDTYVWCPSSGRFGFDL